MSCARTAVERIPRGSWSGYQTDTMPGGIGLLVLCGLLIRDVQVSGGFGAELLGEGDLLRPWQLPDVPSRPSQTARWRVLEPTRVAVLDVDAARRFARYPELTGRLVARALERSRTLAVNIAIVQQARVRNRMHMLLWHLANRWGYVRPEGTVRRPTVSTALARLAKDELVRRHGDGWLLSGQAPRALLELEHLASEPEPVGDAP